MHVISFRVELKEAQQAGEWVRVPKRSRKRGGKNKHMKQRHSDESLVRITNNEIQHGTDNRLRANRSNKWMSEFRIKCKGRKTDLATAVQHLPGMRSGSSAGLKKETHS